MQIIDKLNAGVVIWGEGEIVVEHGLKVSSDIWLRFHTDSKGKLQFTAQVC